MNYLVVCLLVLLSINNGIAVPLDDREVATNKVRDPPPPASNVTANVTWTFTSGVSITNVVVTVYNLQASQYTAVGLSQNKSMGESHVFICKRYADDEIVIERYINPGQHQRPQHAGSEQGGVFTPLPSTFLDGIVTCQFNLSSFSTLTFPQLNTLRPLSQSGQYNPIFAVGVLNSTNDPQFHDGYQPQPSLVQLNQNQNLFYNQTKPPPPFDLF